MRIRQNGFTLIEMAIVLVIIGLIVAGVTGGKNLIRQSRIASVITDVEKYTAVIKNFEERYNSFPGDMSDAEDTWGAATTDNGNDNGQIEAGGEDLLVWEHLGLSGFIPNSYSGSGNFELGINLPQSRIDGVGYWAHHRTTHGTAGNIIMLGSVRTTTALDSSAFITAEEAWAVDKKTDDGEAATGTAMAEETTAAGCIDTSPNPDDYDLTSLVRECRMIFFISEDI